MRLVSAIAERRFFVLFLAILLYWVGTPLLEEWALGKTMLTSFTLAIMLLSALLSVTKSRGPGWLALALGAAAAIATIIEQSSILSQVLIGAFLLCVAAMILRAVLEAERVTLEVVNGALCVYLLLGIVAAAVYLLVETLHPGSFASTPHASLQDRRRALLYFSYATQTTLGYGDITPATPLARSLATVQAIAGQLYLAVLVARLVALEIIHREPQ